MHGRRQHGGSVCVRIGFPDAFWQIPISLAEQKRVCATGLIDGKRKWIAFQSAAQGSAAAPTLWGRLAALVMRLTQSLFAPSKLRLVCYVDDPLAAILGTEDERRMMTTLLVLIWSALGFKLAFAKGQHDRKATLVGGALWIEKHGIRVFVKQSIVEDIQEMLVQFRAINVVGKKELHSLIGKLTHAAGLLVVMRPFVDPLWAAWAANSPNRHP